MARREGQRLVCERCKAEILYLKACHCPTEVIHVEICCGQPMTTVDAGPAIPEPKG